MRALWNQLVARLRRPGTPVLGRPGQFVRHVYLPGDFVVHDVTASGTPDGTEFTIHCVDATRYRAARRVQR